MISKNLYIRILFRVISLLVTSLLLGWSVFSKEWYVTSILLIIIISIITIDLLKFINKTNRRLRYYFDAIQNEDSTLSFPEKTNNKTIQELNKSLNKVNQQIQQIHIKNRQQEQYFRAVIEHIATGIITYNNKGFILHSNSSVKKLLSVDVLSHLNQLERVDHRLFLTIKNIKPSEQRLVTITNERNTIQLSIKASSFISDNDELILLSVQDIKKELDEKELDSWLKLIRVLMHEIMNSITPITSLSESLSGYFCSDGQAKNPEEINEKIIETTIRGLEVIKEQGKGLISFVESYRKLTRLPKPDKKNFSAKSLIENIRILSGSFEFSEKVKLSHTVEPIGLEILGDKKMISQVLINLIKNAFQSNSENKNAKVNITAGLNDLGRPEICISDNGPGISKNLIDEIFVPFFTTRENGSGIGLSISRQIMRLHGGSLKITSTPGKITSAIITF